MVIYISGFQFNISLEDAYDRRMDARETVVGGSIVAYAIATLSHSIGPLLIAIGYVRRNVVAFAVGVTGAVCIFALSGTKTDIATPAYLFALLLAWSLAIESCLASPSRRPRRCSSSRPLRSG